jgi:hypothetical protein
VGPFVAEGESGTLSEGVRTPVFRASPAGRSHRELIATVGPAGAKRVPAIFEANAVAETVPAPRAIHVVAEPTESLPRANGIF